MQTIGEAMSKDDALKIFIELIENDEIPGIEPKHVLRGYKINQFSTTQFHIIYERHPHLYGRPSIGKASSAYATVEYTYLVDTENKKAELFDEKVVDINIDYYSMANEDVLNMIENGLYHELKQVEEMVSEKDVMKYAEKVFNQIEWIPDPSIFISEYDPSNKFDVEKYKRELKEIFMKEFMREWEMLR